MGQPPKKQRRAENPRNEAKEEDQPAEEACEAAVCKIAKIYDNRRQSTSSSPTEEEDDMRRDWICCDVCEKWYHYSCVAIEEWEILIIDKYHCPSCVPTRGPSLQRKAANRHRYEFYRLNADHLPVQIGTPKWMDSFVPREGDFPSPPEDMIRVLEDGHKLKNFWKDDQVWKTPFKIKNKDGLGLKVPEPGFTFADVVDIMGRDRSVDTIDVYGQNTYPMSLGRFLDLYQSENRERLYNILSLEFSTCPKMSELVAPPSIVGEISWVHRFWPEVKHSAHKHLFKEGEFSEELNWVKTCNKTTQVYDPYEEHKKARPDVALFCLAGMGGSFTDFHIDFGGSSVWYNVFKGQKIFYVVEPTEENIGMYDQLQRSQLKYENFLSDQEGVTTYRVVVNEGETLLIPSGWIHAVYTPVDSLVFGGNFLHSLNIKMQIRMNFMEAEQNISVRFRYPSFELCNRYAASVILTTLRKCRKTYSHLPKHFEDGMQTLISAMRRWDKTEAKSDYAWCHPSYGNLTENLRNEFLKYKKRMRKRPPPSEPSVPVAPKPEKVKRVFLSNTINLKPVSNVVLSATPVKKTPSPVDSKSKSKSTSLMPSTSQVTVKAESTCTVQVNTPSPVPKGKKGQESGDVKPVIVPKVEQRSQTIPASSAVVPSAKDVKIDVTLQDVKTDSLKAESVSPASSYVSSSASPPGPSQLISTQSETSEATSLAPNAPQVRPKPNILARRFSQLPASKGRTILIKTTSRPSPAAILPLARSLPNSKIYTSSNGPIRLLASSKVAFQNSNSQLIRLGTLARPLNQGSVSQVFRVSSSQPLRQPQGQAQRSTFTQSLIVTPSTSSTHKMPPEVHKS